MERLGTECFDLLVIGGGITGCGVALDASARGLRTALVEARDFASGTSSKSSKMVHGGLRYLQQHDFSLVYEALLERQRLLRNAPHLVKPLPFLIPLFGHGGMVTAGVARAYSAALWLYDLTGGVRIGRRHRRISANEALEHMPQLRADRLAAAFIYWDAQADDARLTLSIARTAAARGAVLANYAPVASLLVDSGEVRGARLLDGTVVRASVVVNAGGVWCEQIASLGRNSPPPVRVRPAKGVHVAVPYEKLPCDYASVLSVPGDRRSIFVVPWDAWSAPSVSGELRPAGVSGRYTYIGTTDTDYDGDLEEPRPNGRDVDYLLETVNRWTSASLSRADVTGAWAGLRPLVSGARSARTADLSRRHTVICSDDGLVSVTGGKLTTYRRMASDTVDAVVRRLGRGARSSPTARLRLVGAIPAEAVVGGLDGHFIGRYGSEAGMVAGLCDADPSLAEPLVRGLPYLRAEAVFACRHEMAQTVSDILYRRTRAAILDMQAALEAAPAVAELMAHELGWDAKEQAHQVAAFEAEIAADREALVTGEPVSAGGP
jgi:glycerol-3-phosphate dehydrogenase